MYFLHYIAAEMQNIQHFGLQIKCTMIITTEYPKNKKGHAIFTQSDPVGDENDRVLIFSPRRAWTITCTVYRHIHRTCSKKAICRIMYP